MKLIWLLIWNFLNFITCQKLYNYARADFHLADWREDMDWGKIYTGVYENEVIGLLANNSIARLLNVSGEIEGFVIYSANATIEELIAIEDIQYAIRTSRCVYLINFAGKRAVVKEHFGPCNDRHMFPGVLVGIPFRPSSSIIWSENEQPQLYFQYNVRSAGFNIKIHDLYVRYFIYRIDITSKDLTKKFFTKYKDFVEVSVCYDGDTCSWFQYHEGDATFHPRAFEVVSLLPDDTKMGVYLRKPEWFNYIMITWHPEFIKIESLEILGFEAYFKEHYEKFSELKGYADMWLLPHELSPSIPPFIQGYAYDQLYATEYVAMTARDSTDKFQLLLAESSLSVSVIYKLDVFDKLTNILSFVYDKGRFYFLIYPSHTYIVTKAELENQASRGSYIGWKQISATRYPEDAGLSALVPWTPAYSSVYMADGFFLLAMRDFFDGVLCDRIVILDTHAEQFDFISLDDSNIFCLPYQTDGIAGLLSSNIFLSYADRPGIYTLKITGQVPPPSKLTLNPTTMELSWIHELLTGNQPVASFCIRCIPECPKPIAPRSTSVNLLQVGLKPRVPYKVIVIAMTENGIASRHSDPVKVYIVDLPQPQQLKYEEATYRLSWFQEYIYGGLHHFELVCTPTCHNVDTGSPITLPFKMKPNETERGWMSYFLPDYGFQDYSVEYSISVVPIGTDGHRGIISDPISVTMKMSTLITMAHVSIVTPEQLQITYSIREGLGYTYPRSVKVEVVDKEIQRHATLPSFLSGDKMSVMITLGEPLEANILHTIRYVMYDFKDKAVLDASQEVMYVADAEQAGSERLQSADGSLSTVLVSLLIAGIVVAVIAVIIVSVRYMGVRTKNLC